MERLLSRDRNINNNKKFLLTKQEYEKKIDILARYYSDYRSGLFPQRIELHDEIDVFNDLIKKYFELLEVLKEYEINEVYQTMKKNRAYLKPYIRRARKKDFKPKNASSLRTCIRGAFFEELPKCYVLVQRGSNKVIDFGLTKDELKYKIPFNIRKHRNKKFNQWKNMVKHYAQNN